MIGKCNTGGGENLTTQLDNQDAIITEIEAKMETVCAIDVTPEVTAQTPLVTQILEGLVGKAQGANITPETVLKGFKGYSGQELVEGTMEAGINLSDIGITKCAIDEFTFSSDTLASTAVNHSLGEVPKIAFVFTNDAVSHSSGANRVVQAVYVSKIGSGELNLQWDEEIYWNDGSRISQTNSMTITESSFAINGGNSCKYQSGVNYTLITMA